MLATQWVPDVLSVMAWYGLYTWLPLVFTGTSVGAELGYVAMGLALALVAFAVRARSGVECTTCMLPAEPIRSLNTTH